MTEKVKQTISLAMFTTLFFGVLIGTHYLFDSVERAGRAMGSKYLSNPQQITAIAIIRENDDEVILESDIPIGKAIFSPPDWIEEGISEVIKHTGNMEDLSEQALFAARYRAEKMYIESRYDALDNVDGRDFDRRFEWNTAVYTLGDVLFKHSSEYSENTIDCVRNALLWLLQ